VLRNPLILALLGVVAAPIAECNAQQSTSTIGPWDLIAPDSATLLSGGGASFYWLNVVNAPVTVEEAMTSVPMDVQGFANPDYGTEIQVDFQSGVVNNPGADLVMLESAFDKGSYAIYSDYDNYVARVDVYTTNGIIASDQDYYYNGGGPYYARVFGMEIDLSDMGVPAGAMVHSLRFRCIDSTCDPIGLGMISDAFRLDAYNFVAGQTAELKTKRGTPGGLVSIALSFAGNQLTQINVGGCGLLDVNLQYPIQLVTSGSADANGELSYQTPIPPLASGRTIYFQALDFGSCTLSNAVTTVVL